MDLTVEEILKEIKPVDQERVDPSRTYKALSSDIKKFSSIEGGLYNELPKLPICLVQQIISEEFARISDDNSLLTVCRQSGEIVSQVGMHDEKGLRATLATSSRILRPNR